MEFPLIDDSETTGNGYREGAWEPYQEPSGTSGEPESPYDVIFGAPDFTTVIKRQKTARAREYEQTTLSALKAGFTGAVSIGDLTDAAAILKHGPGFATATGILADSSPKVARAIDVLTAPDSPLLLFALAALPFISQVMRNHEVEFKDAPKRFRMRRQFRKNLAPEEQAPPRFTLKLLGRSIPIRFRFRIRILGTVLKGVRMQTAEPVFLVNQVFSDPKVIKELEKQGIYIKLRDVNE